LQPFNILLKKTQRLSLGLGSLDCTKEVQLQLYSLEEEAVQILLRRTGNEAQSLLEGFVVFDEKQAVELAIWHGLRMFI
jgi:hypothetical protein